jgi:hypothetical protein
MLSITPPRIVVVLAARAMTRRANAPRIDRPRAACYNRGMDRDLADREETGTMENKERRAKARRLFLWATGVDPETDETQWPSMDEATIEKMVAECMALVNDEPHPNLDHVDRWLAAHPAK